MNIHQHPSQKMTPATTQAAEGLPRRPWTADDIKKMIASGIIAENERIELIGGEIVPMAAKGFRHEVVKMELNLFWAKRLPDDALLIPETTLWLDDLNFREPDFLFWPRRIPLEDIAADNILLLVEVADSSLAYDLGRKAAYYAEIGIRDYWVINAKTLDARVHRRPGPQGYGDIQNFSGSQTITPEALPGLALCLTDLGLLPGSDGETETGGET